MSQSSEFSGPAIDEGGFDARHGVPVSDHASRAVEPSHHPSTLEMSWTVLDLQTNEASTFDAVGGHFPSSAGGRFLVTAQAADPSGVERMTLDGSGMFDASSEPDEKGEESIPTLRMRASIPRQEWVNSGTAQKSHPLIVIMSPDIGAWDYNELSCGYHDLNGDAGKVEYFATGGVMTFLATATNSTGFVTEASLTTS